MPPKRIREGTDAEDDGEGKERRSARKRSKNITTYSQEVDGDIYTQENPTVTPTKPRRGRPPGSGNKRNNPIRNGILSNADTPTKPKGKVLFSTPLKPVHDGQVRYLSEAPLSAVQNADRSARKKSAKTLIDRTAANALSDENELGDEHLLAKKIWEDDEASTSSALEDGAEDEFGGPSTPDIPSKRRPRARPKKKSPTPPRDLPPHEHYFWHNRPGRVKTSNNTLSGLSLLTHDQYHDQISSYADPHAEAFQTLYTIHARSFPQWRFELSQAFNICLYGYGSKRRLVTAFGKYLHAHLPQSPKILMVNGYTPTLTLRNVFTTLATLVYDCKPSDLPQRLGSQPRDILAVLLAHLTAHPPEQPINVFINSLDAAPLRRSPTPSILGQLASHPSINMLATCDKPNFPLLWDTALRDQYNWLFHDTTTFESYGGVEVGSVIDEVNELLGRSGRAVKGKEGVGFVLRSLPENARNLYRVLIAEILAAVDNEGGDNDDRLGEEGKTGDLGGVEYRTLYQKVVEEFICSSEMGFRQLLKEFYDHDMLVSKRDTGAGGGEVLRVPWRREECMDILEELMG
ncbi:MAG: hypothetical protein Q9163_001463 [Psora crenata]